MPRPIEPVLDDIFYRRGNLDNFGDKQAEPFGSEGTDDTETDDEEDINRNSMLHTAPGGGVHGPYRIQESGGGYDVVNDNGESKGHHDTYDEAREQQKALYVNVPEAQEQAKEDEESKKESSRRRLADSDIVYERGVKSAADDDDDSTSGPTFTSPGKGSWTCSDCGAPDLGVHDLNGHAEAHRQTTHRSGYELFL